VRDFDKFRAPLTADDRARRNPSALTPRQCEHLDRWGYPYVMEDFRFHMTLTGRLEAQRREPILAMLRGRFSALGLTRLAIDQIAVFRRTARIPGFGSWTSSRSRLVRTRTHKSRLVPDVRHAPGSDQIPRRSATKRRANSEVKRNTLTRKEGRWAWFYFF